MMNTPGVFFFAGFRCLLLVLLLTLTTTWAQSRCQRIGTTNAYCNTFVPSIFVILV